MLSENQRFISTKYLIDTLKAFLHRGFEYFFKHRKYNNTSVIVRILFIFRLKNWVAHALCQDIRKFSVIYAIVE